MVKKFMKSRKCYVKEKELNNNLKLKSKLSNKEKNNIGKKILTKDGKVAIQVLIPMDLYEALLRVGPSIYGMSRGWLSALVEEALRQFLAPRLHTQIHTNPRYGVLKVWYAIIEKIKEILNTPIKPKEVPEKILNLAISEVRGSDPRTIEKWKKVFQQHGLIKHVGGSPPNRIFELFIV